MKIGTYRGIGRLVRYLQISGALLVLALALGLWQPLSLAQSDPQAPQYRVDPFWPKPLPSSKDANGVARQWITGSVGEVWLAHVASR